MIGEAEAYRMLHGDRSEEVRVVAARPAPALPERRLGHHVTVEGETLRAAFERKFAHRAKRS